MAILHVRLLVELPCGYLLDLFVELAQILDLLQHLYLAASIGYTAHLGAALAHWL